MPNPDFKLPDTVEEVEALRCNLIAEIQIIQAQLGDKARTDDSGRRLDSKDYWNWRRHAQHALTRKLEQLRLVKQWLRSRHVATKAATYGQLRDSLGALWSICENLKSEDVDFTTHELEQIRAAGDLLNSN